MEIPVRLKQLLERDPTVHAAILKALNDFTPWLELSGTPFFPEYTRHDPHHVQRVLQAATALVRDEAWTVLSSTDAAVLIIAGLLHDSALHLTEAGFLQLVNGTSRSKATILPSDKPWPVLWEEFLSRARRFNARQLRDLFGDLEPVQPLSPDPRNWTLRDRLLIGDFLRLHHHRLAHEIALWGVPGPLDQKPMQLELEHDFSDLAGLVARSHGMPLRDAFGYLRERYDLRQYRGVHSVFLMVLLRIADYIQVTADRAPKQLLQVKRLWSPFSLGKWKEHHAIRDIRTTHDDPEAIFVDAAPQSADLFLSLKSLLEDLQKEFDVSWAVLGEVYGRWEELRALGLTLRRVRSTFDDENALSESLDYIPRRAAFEAASGDLIPLLVEPLYGDHPEVGVRELVQNAVDAVRELRVYQRRSNSELTDPVDPEVSAEVEVDENDVLWLRVDDKGIGMTADTVCSYFLKIGASFRRSDFWRQTFETEEGESRILRSGRFGIGVLAAFLLGEEIQVSTRHIDAEEGVSFSATLSTDNIELRKSARPPGTTVRVKLSDEAQEVLKESEPWDWYCLPDPKVVRSSPDSPNVPQKHKLPASRAPLPLDWHRIIAPGYEDIQWTFSKAPQLTCNGIKISDDDYSDRPFRRDGGWSLSFPNISVFDPDGRLPLDLSRTALTHDLPFEEEVIRDILKDFIAFSLIEAPTRRRAAYRLWDRVFSYKGIYKRWMHSAPISPWFFAPTGTGLTTRENILGVNSTAVAVAPLAPSHDLLDGFSNIDVPILWIREMGMVGASVNDYLVNRILHAGNHEKDFLHHSIRPLGARILIRSDWANRLLNGTKYVRLKRSVASEIQTEQRFGNWDLWAYRNCPLPNLDFERLAAKATELANQWAFGVAEIYPNQNQDPEPYQLVDQVWQEVIGHPTIPFDQKKRRATLQTAFQKLESYLTAHREVVEELGYY